MTTPRIDDAQIAEAAFRLWENEGRPDGRAEEHWHRARTALEAVAAPGPDAVMPRARPARARTAPKPAAPALETVPAAAAPKAPRARKPKAG